MAFKLTSTAFDDGQSIPRKYTGDGPDVSPPLQWTEPPAPIKSFALICDDPDAPGKTWVHWVMFNIPQTARNLPEGVPPERQTPSGDVQGVNDFGNIGYGGPAPPKGHGPHRYYFKLYALDCLLSLDPGARKSAVIDAMNGHIVAETQLVGRYER